MLTRGQSSVSNAKFSRWTGRHRNPMVSAMASGQPANPEKEAAAALLQQVASAASLPPDVAPHEALFAVTCVLRQRLSRGAGDELVESLPSGVQDLITGCNRRYAEAAEAFGREEFIIRVANYLRVDEGAGERISRTIFRVLQERLPDEVIHDVSSQLPGDLRAWWVPRGSDAEARAMAGSPETTLARETALTRQVLDLVRSSGVLAPEDSERAAVAAVICVLCQRLSGGGARDLYESLPAGLHSWIARCALRRDEQAEPFHREEFFQRVADRLGVDAGHGEAITRVVFAAVMSALPLDEVHDVASQLPLDLKELWLGASASAGMPAP